MHDRPPSDGSPASPAAAARAAADPVPFTLRTSINDNFEVAGFGQVRGTTTRLEGALISKSPRHQAPGRLRLTTKPCSGCSSIKTATPTAGPWASSSPRMRCESRCSTQRAPSRSHSVSSSTGDCDLELPTTGLVHQPRRTMAPSTTSLHRRTPSPPPALGHPSRPPTGCRSSHPNLSALGTEPTEPSRTPASCAAPRSPAETGSARL
mmetsp:Transcript_12443/g.39845  ORF Transcript_12443/g.39845 Transcript_12443/m.39845 type:complete len:208 (-) Transcript_12443:73-696(-)